MRRTTEHGRAASPRGFVRRLGEAGYGPEHGRVGALDLLARSGLPVPEGFVLTAEGHREFLRMGERGARRLGEALEREIRAALLDLGARTVIVGWGWGARRGLGTIPAVVAAIREAWEPGRYDPAGGEGPTWPILVQRQSRPAYTGWTTTADLRSGYPVRRDVPLHDLEPGQEGPSRLTRVAATVLEGPVRLGWGLEDGRWLLVSVEEEPGQQA